MTPKLGQTMNLLSLDGGGMRGLSELFILENMMQKLKIIDNLDTEPLPCDYFDMICGTSTGGIIAIMLGRLRMSVRECIDAYLELSKKVFAQPLVHTQGDKFDPGLLEQGIKSLVRLKIGDENAPLLDSTCCKTFVCTYEARALGGSPVLLSTYSTNSAHINCTIWEAARATSAEPIFFPPIKLADHAGGDFMDTGVGFNNPTKILVKEAKSYYRLKGYSASQPTCLVSIGTGQKDPTQTQRAASLFWFKDRGGMSISPVLEEIFTDCENTHDEVTQSCVEDDATDIYFRFNVLQGMQNIVLDEWTKPNDIRTYTDKYMRLNQTSHEISECIKLLRCKVREVGNGDFERLLAMNHLAITLQNQGNLKEATRMYTEVLKKAKQMYGGEHLNTLSAMTKLAIALNYQGEREVATRLFTEVVEKKKQILGDEHPDTLSSMSNLANILSQQQKFAAAVAIGKGVLEKRKRILGEEHLDTISGMSNLAIVLKLQGKFEEATMMFTKVFEKREQVLGDKHLDTISAMSNLANTLLAQNNLEAAVAMGKEVLRKLTRILGSEHLDSISALDNLAIALECQGKHEEAAVMFTKVFEKREQVLGDEHPDTILAKQLLSHALAGQGKLQEGATIAARQDVTGKQIATGKDAEPATRSRGWVDPSGAAVKEDDQSQNPTCVDDLLLDEEHDERLASAAGPANTEKTPADTGKEPELIQNSQEYTVPEYVMTVDRDTGLPIIVQVGRMRVRRGKGVAPN